MPQSEPITILIVNEHAEEIKLVTISLRGFFSDVRIDVAYSTEEADRMTSGPVGGWAVVLIDEACLPMRSTFISELKRRASSRLNHIAESRNRFRQRPSKRLKWAQTCSSNKHSPAFLTELLVLHQGGLRQA